MTGKPRATRRDIVFPKGKYTRAARIRAGSGHGSMKEGSLRGQAPAAWRIESSHRAKALVRGLPWDAR